MDDRAVRQLRAKHSFGELAMLYSVQPGLLKERCLEVFSVGIAMSFVPSPVISIFLGIPTIKYWWFLTHIRGVD